MKSRAASAPNVSIVLPPATVWAHSGPTPAMNSTVLDRVQGFLNRKSVSHSVWPCWNSGPVPASSSSQFSTGVTSTAADGPKPAPPPFRLYSAVAPISRVAIPLPLRLSQGGPSARQHGESQQDWDWGHDGISRLQ